MSTYLPDTNVLIGFGRDEAIENKLGNAVAGGSLFVLAPSTIEELSRGVINGGAKHFQNDQRVFTWLRLHNWPVLELPIPFMGNVLGSPARQGRVIPEHYVQLMDMIAQSADYDDFMHRKGEKGSVWTDIDRTKAIHDGILDKEIADLEKVAQEPKPVDAAARLIRRFGAADLNAFRGHFSAAIEFAESAIAKIKGGANHRKNDPGVFGDFQLFFYLADPKPHLLTREDFSSYIKNSPQKARIVRLDALP